MPLIVVQGLTTRELENFYLDTVRKAITDAIVGVQELGLTPEDISFSFVHDPSITWGNTGVVIIVELLFDKPKRTFEVRQRLAARIASEFKNVPGNKNRMVEVAVKRFNPTKDGFARLDR